MYRYVAALFAFLTMLLAMPAQAERVACKATYDAAAGTLSLEAADAGSNRYIVKLTSVTGSSALRFQLASVTLLSNHDCYDAAMVGSTTLTIPDLAVADSYFTATLSLVAGNGPTRIELATSNPATTQFDVSSSSKNPRLIPDAGLRITAASNPFATVGSSGITYLGYQDARIGYPQAFQSSSDGLNFSNPTTLTYNNRSVDSRRTLMPDGKTWRLYMFNQTGVMTSYISSDGNVFVPESGTRYTAQTTDNGSTGVYDQYVAGDGAVVLVYVGDLMGRNNLRMAKSTDNGVTFAFVKGNVLGDDDAYLTSRSFIDNKTILLADGRRRMFTMRSGELQSFITSDGYTWSRESGTRISYRNFAAAGLTLYSLNDPVPVIDKNGKLKVYVATSTAPLTVEGPGNTNWGIVSATWDDNAGSGTLQASAPVIEFYHSGLDHYFITANAIEAAAIDNGSAGAGWSRTGLTFKSGGTTPVCRFYGSQSPGPNSHFYTVDAAECASLKQLQASTPDTQKRWNFEALDFVSTPPTTGGINGSCAGGTVPVYRAYNNGSTRNVDSNHRITGSQAALQEVVARGWKNEGIVMCAPN
jgi:hypothetical protein